MKKSKLIFLITISLVLLFSLTGEKVSGQGVDIRAGSKQHPVYIGLNLGTDQTRIDNQVIKALEGLISLKEITFSAQAEMGIRLNKNFGLSAGLGYRTYSSGFLLLTYRDSLVNQKDQDNDTYIRRISGKDITETQKIGIISIPVRFNAELPLNDIFGFFLQAGVNLSVPVNKKFSSTGMMTYAGYYPAYNIVITGVDHEGFAQNATSMSEGTLIVSSIIPEFATSAGFTVDLNEKIRLLAGISYTRVLTDISGYSADDAFHLSVNKDEMNSLMAGSSKVTAQAVGLRLGFRYYLK